MKRDSFQRYASAWAACLLGPIVVSAQVSTYGAEAVPQREGVPMTPRRSLERRFIAAGSLVVVDRNDIEQTGPFSVADLLRQLPGLLVTPSSDGSMEFHMRGEDRGATQLLIDRQQESNKRYQLPINQLLLELIERIELVRAPAAEFSGATVGTISIVLRQVTAKRETVPRLTDDYVWGRNAGQAFFRRTAPIGAPAAHAHYETQVGSAPDQPCTYFLSASATELLLGSDTQRSTQCVDVEVAASDTTSSHKRTDYGLVPRVSGRSSAANQVVRRASLSRTHFSGDASSLGTGEGTYASTLQESHRHERHYLGFATDWILRLAASKLDTTLLANRGSDNLDRDGVLVFMATFGAVTDSHGLLDDRRGKVVSRSTKFTGSAGALLLSTGVYVEDRQLSVRTTASVEQSVNSALESAVPCVVLWGQNEWELPANTVLTLELRGEQVMLDSGSALTEQQRRHWSTPQPSLHTLTPVSEDLQLRVNLARVTQLPRDLYLVGQSNPSQVTNSLSNSDTLGPPSPRLEVIWTLDTGFERRLAVGQASSICLCAG